MNLFPPTVSIFSLTVSSLRFVHIISRCCHFSVKLAEEILHDSRAHWLSDDNRYVAYMQFNDTNVPLELFPVYNDPTDVYGAISEVSYPKV